MRIKSIRLENFRSFTDQTILLNDYTCLVGPNGAGKSTVLCALNVFFQEQDASATNVQKLCDEDFFERRTDAPLKITVTFTDLSEAASEELSDYVRSETLVVTAEATFDKESEVATVHHYGQRLGIEEFRSFFEAIKAGAKKEQLDSIYGTLQESYAGLPKATSKAAKQDALQEYEREQPDECVLIPSEDNFYGINGTGKLAKHVQWVYVPAVKDASQEGQEAKNSAFSRLIARTVRAKTNFDKQVDEIRDNALEQYQKLLADNQSSLDDLSQSLRGRLESWAHAGVKLDVQWLFDRLKSVQIAQPTAGIRTGDGEFLGSLSRMGHGLQRSYLLALLHELSASDDEDAPTLILGCEEPELYQHPPQARHLADVFVKLSEGNSQVIVTTHSPLFVNGQGFEDVRLIRKPEGGTGTVVTGLSFTELCGQIREAKGQDPSGRQEGLIAKLHQALRPHISEMFFARLPILVEGLEDASYLTTWLTLTGRFGEFRRLGCHFVPVNGKDKLIQPLAIARSMNVPYYVVFDADGGQQSSAHENKHRSDNVALFNLLQSEADAFPSENICEQDHAVWKDSLTQAVSEEVGADCDKYKEAARVLYAHEGGLEKHDLFIAEWVSAAYQDGMRIECLESVCDKIIRVAGNLV